MILFYRQHKRAAAAQPQPLYGIKICFFADAASPLHLSGNRHLFTQPVENLFIRCAGALTGEHRARCGGPQPQNGGFIGAHGNLPRGGGRPNMAQAGGKNPEAVDAAIEKAMEVLKEQIK